MENINLQQLQKIFSGDACFSAVTGVRLTAAGPGWAKAELVLGPQHLNPLGTVHGGCIFTLADTVSGAAAFTYGCPHTTVSSDIHFLNAAKNSKVLYASASTVKHGGHVSVLETRITDDAGALIATFCGTFYALPQRS